MKNYTTHRSVNSWTEILAGPHFAIIHIFARFLMNFSFIIYSGVKAFATSESTVAKWVMNRSFQSRFVESLIEKTGLSKMISNPRKCLRPSKVLKENIVEALTTQFLNPFDRSELYNLVSGCPVVADISKSLLNLEE